MSTYHLPDDDQKIALEARSAAKQDVQNAYPNVYREQWEMENHGRAVAERATDSNPNLVNDRSAYINQYAKAYASAYQQEMQQLDSQKPAPPDVAQ